ncbi:MAG TPA: thiolase family protein [Acidimicrobiales bacterium]|nr:thiolase family protein [Acidimicrobiales bacterium]
MAVLGFARSPFGKFGGSLREATLPDLASAVVTAGLSRSGVAPDQVDQLVFGVNFPGSDRSIARQILLRSDIPVDRNAYTVDRACCSSLTALAAASRSIRLGEASVAVAGGAENLSRVPYFLEGVRWGHRLGNLEMSDQLVISCPHTHEPRARQASREALEHGIGRAQQDDWAVRSQERYAKALAAGWPAEEIVPVPGTDSRGATITVEADEVPRPGTTAAALAALSTIYESETVTPGNAPDLSSGSAALVLADPRSAAERGRPVLATLRGFAAVSGEPQRIASIPATAVAAALDRAELTLDQVDLIEINEAFAAVPLVTTLILADGDEQRAEVLRKRTNVNGGSVAIGHPTGATAARMVMTAICELRRRGGGTAAVALCGGIGEGEAVIVEVDGQGSGAA